MLFFLQDIEEKAPMIATLDVADEVIPEVEAFLQDYTETTENLPCIFCVQSEDYGRQDKKGWG